MRKNMANLKKKSATARLKMAPDNSSEEKDKTPHIDNISKNLIVESYKSINEINNYMRQSNL
ncbi:hypothetical protein PFDG_05194, partial [Plasmodium falciparum Dd2]